jgi:hypothetical protein
LFGIPLSAPDEKNNWSRRFLVREIAVVLPVFCRRDRAIRLGLDGSFSPQMVTLVHSWVSFYSIHILFSGSGQRRDQWLVRRSQRLGMKPQQS